MQTNPGQYSVNRTDVHGIPDRKSEVEKMTHEAVWLKLLIVT